MPPYSYMTIVLRLIKGSSNQEIYDELAQDRKLDGLPDLEFEKFLEHVEHAKDIVRDYIRRGRTKELYDTTYITNREMTRLINPPAKIKIKPETRTDITSDQRSVILKLRENGFGPTVIAKYLNIPDIEAVNRVIEFGISRGKIQDVRTCDLPQLCYKTAKQEMDELLAEKTNRTKKTAVTV